MPDGRAKHAGAAYESKARLHKRPAAAKIATDFTRIILILVKCFDYTKDGGFFDMFCQVEMRQELQKTQLVGECGTVLNGPAILPPGNQSAVPLPSNAINSTDPMIHRHPISERSGKDSR